MNRNLIRLSASVAFAFTMTLPVQWNGGNPVFDAPSAHAKSGSIDTGKTDKSGDSLARGLSGIPSGQSKKEYENQSAHDFTPKSVEATLARIAEEIAKLEEEEAAEAKLLSEPGSVPLAPTLSKVLSQYRN